MLYTNEHFDHIFFRMKESLPVSQKFYYFIVAVKLAPLFLQAHSGGYSEPANSSTTIHTYFKYLSLTFYIENSLDLTSIVAISGVLLAINILFILMLIYYLSQAKRVQKIDENYGSQNSLDYFFSLFSNFVFFKYILLCQFFYEINFLPLVCVKSSLDLNKLTTAGIFSNINTTSFDTVCSGSNFIIFLLISCLNMVIDLCYYYLLSARFFDYNILSNYFFNSLPNFMHSLLFLESLAQIFFVMFINYKNSSYKLIFGIYVYFLLLTYIVRYFTNREFYSLKTKITMKILDFVRTMVIIAQVIVQIFQTAVNESPNDINVIGIIIIEFIIALLKYSFFHRNDTNKVASVITLNLAKLNEKNIYFIFTYLITEFRIFSDINYKFDDKNLDLFLENYVQHLKHCEDFSCPCKNYLKKVANSSNTLKSGYTTVINFSHLGPSGYQEEYILNKFFNVLSANVSTTIKYTNNNVNINSIKDNNKQKIIYNLRIRLITAVKKLISYRLEYLFNNLDSLYTQNFSDDTKHFIRINYFSLQLLCNRSYYKTFFQFHEFLSDFHKKHGKGYKMYMIYYFYLKKFGIKEYNDLIAYLKSLKRDSSVFNLDFRKILAVCIKFYDIEEKLVENVVEYKNFIEYFEEDYVVFEKLLQKVKKFKSGYKNLTRYIRYFFKNEKLNNLFICSKIILFFKILQFDIPETLHNKLIVQSHDEETMRTNHYIDTNYYLITNYREGDFVIKFISHELLIILEYSEEELRDQDFQILMPEKMRKGHKHILISDIKNRNNHNVQYKEIFLVSKRRTSILFDLHFKIMLNLKGEITMLSVVNLKNPKSDFRTCFACVDDEGEVLAMNREFEEYLILSMKVLDHVHIDSEKIILQNRGNIIRTFFKEEENYNAEFFDKFDYEYYLSCLFGEEFEGLRDRNETLFKKKLARWQSLREIIKRGRCYNQYIDIYVRRRIIHHQRFYFIKYLIRANLTVKSFEPYNTTLSLINAVKISKKEMAKLSFYKLEEIYEAKSEFTGEDKANESQDFLNESQSILSSAASILKERNSKRLFRAKKNRFKFLPKSRNILILTIILASLSFISIIYNVISLFIKYNYINNSHDVMRLDLDIVLLKSSLFYTSSGIVNLALIEEDILPYNKSQMMSIKPFPNNTIDLISRSVNKLVQVIYEINYLNNDYFNIAINNKLSEVNNNFTFIFKNGLIYKKGSNTLGESSLSNSGLDAYTFKEISTFHTSAYNFLQNYKKGVTSGQSLNEYILFDKITQNSAFTNTNILTDDDTFVFYIINNLFEQFEPYFSEIQVLYDQYYSEVSGNMKINNTIIKAFEFFLVVLIIFIEFIFIFIGYEKAKVKMIKLKKQIRGNKVDLTVRKIDEFVKFCNTFNIYSLYLIADFELSPRKSNDDKDKPQQIVQQIQSKKILRGAQKEKEKEMKEPTEILLLKNLKDPSSPTKTFQDFENEKSSFLSNNEETTQVGKGLKKLEFIKKQRRATMFYKKDSQNSKLIDSEQESPNKLLENPDTSSNIFSNDILGGNLDVPSEKYEREDVIGGLKAGGATPKPHTSRDNNNAIISELVNPQKNDIAIAASLDKLSAISKKGGNSPVRFRENPQSNQPLNTEDNTKSNMMDNIYETTEGKPVETFSLLNKKNFNPKMEKNTYNSNSQSDSNRSIKSHKIRGVLKNINMSNRNLIANLFSNNDGATTPTNMANNSNNNTATGEKVEESNQQLLLPSDGELTPVSMLKNPKRKTIKFTDKNVKRFYIPEKGINDHDISPHSRAMSNMQKKAERLVMEGKDLPPILEANSSKTLNTLGMSLVDNSNSSMQNKTNNPNPNALTTHLENGGIYFSNTDENESDVYKSPFVKDKQDKAAKSDRPAKDIDIADLKGMNLKEYKLLNNTNLTTVKRRAADMKENAQQQDEIEEKVGKIVNSNFTSKLILSIFGFIFFILYLINILFNLQSYDKLSSLIQTSKILLAKVDLLNELVMKYRLDIYTNHTHDDMNSLFNDVYSNMQSVISAEQTGNLQLFPKTYLLENIFSSGNSCANISLYFSEFFNTALKNEIEECQTVGNQINKNGLQESYLNIVNGMQQLRTDMNNLTNLSEESLLSKLDDMSFFYLTEGMDYTFFKYNTLLSDYIFTDAENFFTALKNTEDIFSYSSIILNVIFAISTLAFIIVPIKYVEMIISWVIHKLNKTT